MLHIPINNWTTEFTEILGYLDALRIPGCIAEFGVYDGGSTILLADSPRQVWAFDTFEGIPMEEFQPGLDTDEPGKFKPSAPPEVMFKDFPNIHPVVGRFEKTLPYFNRRVAFAFVDCDLYVSHQQVLEKLSTLLVPGAMILFDNYQWLQGARNAIDPWLAKHGLKILNKNLVLWRNNG